MFYNNINKDNVAIMDVNGNSKTYSELWEEAEELKKSMESRSVIFILCDQTFETISFYYKILCIKAVPLVIDHNIDSELILKLIEQYHPAYIWCKADRTAGISMADEKAIGSYSLIRTTFDKYQIHDELALLMSTSGSTGSQKLVRTSYHNIMYNTKYMSENLKMQSSDVGMLILPMSYAFGIAFCNWHWYLGAAVLIFNESVLSKKFVDVYKTFKPNNLPGVPFTFQMLDKMKFFEESENLQNLSMVMSAGAKLPEHLQHMLFEKLQDKFWVCYGQTECTSMVTALHDSGKCSSSGVIGIPFKEVTVSIDDKTGEMLLDSETICMGYAESWFDLIQGNINNGYLATGDIVELDADGNINIIGRAKRFIKILGKRVSLDELETLLHSKFIKTDIVCAGADDCVRIYCTNQESPKEIRRFVRDKMNIPSNMIAVEYINTIPRNEAGKIKYKEL